MPHDRTSAAEPLEGRGAAATVFVGTVPQGPFHTPTRVSGPAGYAEVFGAQPHAPTPLEQAVQLFFANGGEEALVVGVPGSAAADLVPAGGGGGLHAVTQPFGLLVLPGVTARDRGAVDRALHRCEQERAVLVLDLPAGVDVPTAARLADGVTGPRERVAAYHPWVVVRGQVVPPAGAVAGVLARSDASRGVATPPAGQDADLRGVDGIAGSLGAPDVELLAEHGVNALRTLRDGRTVVWGARLLAATGSVEPAHRYLPARRLTDLVLGRLEAETAFVGERRPDPGVWELVRCRAEELLTGLWRSGVLAGQTPQEAYFVRCDGRTTTEADRRAGRLVLLVGLALARPSEFEVHTLLLRSATVADPPVLPRTAARARAAAVARERGSVPRTVDLGPLSSAHLAETERQLAHIFEEAAAAGTVLLFDEADALFGSRTEGGCQQRTLGLCRNLEELSRRYGVPYVLSGRADPGRDAPRAPDAAYPRVRRAGQVARPAELRERLDG